MEKIEWDLNKDAGFLKGKLFIVCNNCGWLVSDPRVSDEKHRKCGEVNDDRCPNCKKLYKETNSEIGEINDR